MQQCQKRIKRCTRCMCEACLYTSLHCMAVNRRIYDTPTSTQQSKRDTGVLLLLINRHTPSTLPRKASSKTPPSLAPSALTPTPTVGAQMAEAKWWSQVLGDWAALGEDPMQHEGCLNKSNAPPSHTTASIPLLLCKHTHGAYGMVNAVVEEVALRPNNEIIIKQTGQLSTNHVPSMHFALEWVQ